MGNDLRSGSAVLTGGNRTYGCTWHRPRKRVGSCSRRARCGVTAEQPRDSEDFYRQWTMRREIFSSKITPPPKKSFLFNVIFNENKIESRRQMEWKWIWNGYGMEMDMDFFSSSTRINIIFHF